MGSENSQVTGTEDTEGSGVSRAKNVSEPQTLHSVLQSRHQVLGTKNNTPSQLCVSGLNPGSVPLFYLFAFPGLSVHRNPWQASLPCPVKWIPHSFVDCGLLCGRKQEGNALSGYALDMPG